MGLRAGLVFVEDGGALFVHIEQHFSSCSISKNGQGARRGGGQGHSEGLPLTGYNLLTRLAQKSSCLPSSYWCGAAGHLTGSPMSEVKRSKANLSKAKLCKFNQSKGKQCKSQKADLSNTGLSKASWGKPRKAQLSKALQIEVKLRKTQQSNAKRSEARQS